MEDNRNCVVLSKKEYDGLGSRSNIPGLKTVAGFGYRWGGVVIHVGGTSDPSGKSYCQIRRICDGIFERTQW